MWTTVNPSLSELLVFCVENVSLYILWVAASLISWVAISVLKAAVIFFSPLNTTGNFLSHPSLSPLSFWKGIVNQPNENIHCSHHVWLISSRFMEWLVFSLPSGGFCYSCKGNPQRKSLLMAMMIMRSELHIVPGVKGCLQWNRSKSSHCFIS